MYEAEKDLLDRWALWREHGFYDLSAGQSPLAKLGEYGMRVGAVNYTNSPATDEDSPKVEAFMRALVRDLPKAHLCLEAKHRRVVGALRIGLKVLPARVAGGKPRMRPYRDGELALLTLADDSPAGRQRFIRLCDEGYKRLRSFMAA